MSSEKLESFLDMEWELKDYENIMFGDYESNKIPKEYMKLNEINVLIPTLDEALELYNAENSPMNLVFFGDCI